MNIQKKFSSAESGCGDTLFQQRSTKTDLQITCGYKEAIVLHDPSSSVSKDDASFSFFIDQGEQAKNIIIFAENLYLESGKRYEFPGKKVMIYARNISTNGSSPAVISVNGLDGKNNGSDVNATKAKAGAHGTSGQHPTPGLSGDTGTNQLAGGGPGDPGLSAGEIYICADRINTTKIILEAKGGNGKRGGNGGNGQQGGNGGQGGQYTGLYNGTNGTPPKKNTRGGDGGTGGNGSNGHDGAPGGNGGKITVNTLADVSATLSTSVDYGQGGAGGNKGLAGKGGDPGDGGEASEVTECAYDVCQTKTVNQGDKGSSGKTGAHDGVGGFPGNKGGQGHYESYKIDEKQYVSNVGVHFLNSLRRRLEFFYLTHLTISQLKKVKKDALLWDLPEFLSFKDTLSWLGELFKANITDDEEFKCSKNNFALFCRKIKQKKDYYGNYFNAIPQINWDIKDFGNEINQFDNLMYLYDSYTSWLDGYDLELDYIKQTYENIKKTISSKSKEENAFKEQLSSLRDQIEKKSETADNKEIILQEKLQSLEEEIKNTVGCDASDVLGCLSLITFAAAGEFDPMMAMGAAMQGVSLLENDNIDVGPAGAVDKKYLVQNVLSVESDLNSLQEGYTNAKGYISEDDPYGEVLSTEQQKFEILYENYFAQLNAGDEAKAAFQDYVDAIRDRNSVIASYNGIYTTYASDQALTEESEAQKAFLDGHLSELNTDRCLSYLSDYFAKEIHSTKLKCIYDLYSFCRAYRGLTLKESASLQSISQLQDYNQLNPLSLTNAYNILKAELNDFKTELAQHRRAKQTVDIIINDKNNPDFKRILANLMQDKSFVYLLSADSHDELQNKADIRIEDICVYLVGASTGNRVVDLSIRQTGFYKLFDVNQHEFDFIYGAHGDTYTIDYPFSYEYENPSDKITFKLKSGPIPNLGETQFVFEDGASGSLSAPLLSPYSNWQIKVTSTPETSGGNVDLSNITEIIFSLSIVYRDFLS